MSEDERAMALKQCEVTQQENRHLSDEHRKEMASTTLTVDDLKMKVNSNCICRVLAVQYDDV